MGRKRNWMESRSRSTPMRKAQPTLLEIRISGPGVKPGCIALGLLYKICHEAQEAVNRQAQALESEDLPKTAEYPIQVAPGRLINQSFFTTKTIKQLIAEQHVHPIANISILSGAIPDEDVDEFVAEIYRDRKG